MAKQAVFTQDGKTLDMTLTADVSVGDVVVEGDFVGIANNAGLTGEVVAVHVDGVWKMNARTADAIAVGSALYWDDVNDELTIVTTGNKKAGLAVSSKAAATAGTVLVKIGA